MIKIQNYIDGRLCPAVDGGSMESIEPATGKVLATLPDSNSKDVDLAVIAAKKAFSTWGSTTAEYRSRLLLTISTIIERHLDALAQDESADNGKPVKLASTIDIPRAASNFRFFANSIVGFSSEAHIVEQEAVNYTRRAPIGVVGCISPWNLPLYLFTWKIAPALAAGNCVVAKPSELTPLTAFRLSEICIEAGLPPGVLNIVHGTGADVGQAIVEHQEISAISFTGGTQTGKKIAATAAPMFKKLSLELGGKNPTIIFDDCDYQQMLDTTIRSAFANQGEICLCGSRIFIQNTLYDQFKSDFIGKVKALTVGDPQSDVNLGALISQQHLEKIESFVELGLSEGGTLLTGGHRSKVSGRCEGGFFFEPTVLEGLGQHCQINQQEIFGPVVTLIPFSTEEDLIAMANDTQFGLAANIWTNNITRAHNIAHQLKSGIVWINCWLLRDLRTPFGGMKASGVGREGGNEALRFFTEPQNICVKL